MIEPTVDLTARVVLTALLSCNCLAESKGFETDAMPAKEKIKIAVPEQLSGLHNENGTGPSDIILKRFISMIPDEYYEVHKLPLKRAIELTVSQKFDCFLGASPGDFELYTSQPSLDSLSYAEIEWRFMSRIDKPVITSLRDLNDIKLAGVLGTKLSLQQIMGKQKIDVQVEEVYSEKLALRMVLRGRVEAAFLGFQPSVKVEKMHYDKNFLHIQGGRMLSCYRKHTLANKLINDFNKAVKAMAN